MNPFGEKTLVVINAEQAQSQNDSNMRNYKSREELRAKIIQAFAAQEEIYQIFFFGKEVEGKVDGYSDIDTVVCSKDIARTQKAYKKTFSTISPIRSTLMLASSPEHFAEMIMLKEYDPYQKIDFSIAKRIRDKAEFGPFTLVYDKTEAVSTSAPHPLEVIPIKRSVIYILNDVLFSVARFTKCLFRRDIDMYRRWKGITDIVGVLLYEKYFGWEAETLKQRLTAHETKHLSKELEEEDTQRLDSIYPKDGNINLLISYQTSIDLFIELSIQKAAAFNIPLDSDFITYIKAFMDFEIKRYQCNSDNKGRISDNVYSL